MNVKCLLAVMLILGVTACAPNAAFRTQSTELCTGGCAKGTAKTEDFGAFKVSYLEFSERGNLFDRDGYADIVRSLQEDAESPNGILLIVFVHGWKHNAEDSDRNVDSFRKAMAQVESSRLAEGRRVRGVYVGWRGRSLYGTGIENFSYWDRKATAQEVGHGGVTDVLLRMEKITGRITDPSNRNRMVTVGHSFGGAVVLSALNDVFLDRMNSYLQLKSSGVGRESAASSAMQALQPAYPAFGSGVVLLNPAIEADQIFALKELSFEIGQDRVNRAIPLRIVSSRADKATRTPFAIGQWLDSLAWRHANIQRTFRTKTLSFPERSLDTQTIGNYAPFRTHEMAYDAATQRWNMKSLCNTDRGAGERSMSPRMPCTESDPIAFLSTPEEFIEDHNDVFNRNVLAFVAATILEGSALGPGGSSPAGRKTYAECSRSDGGFDFDACFARSLKLF